MHRLRCIRVLQHDGTPRRGGATPPTPPEARRFTTRPLLQQHPADPAAPQGAPGNPAPPHPRWDAAHPPPPSGGGTAAAAAESWGASTPEAHSQPHPGVITGEYVGGDPALDAWGSDFDVVGNEGGGPASSSSSSAPSTAAAASGVVEGAWPTPEEGAAAVDYPSQPVGGDGSSHEAWQGVPPWGITGGDGGDWGGEGAGWGAGGGHTQEGGFREDPRMEPPKQAEMYDAAAAPPAAVQPGLPPTWEQLMEFMDKAGEEREKEAGGAEGVEPPAAPRQRIKVSRMVELRGFPGILAAMAELVKRKEPVTGDEIVFLAERLLKEVRRISRRKGKKSRQLHISASSSEMRAMDVQSKSLPISTFRHLVKQMMVLKLIHGRSHHSDAVYNILLKCYALTDRDAFLKLYYKGNSKKRAAGLQVGRTEKEHLAYLTYVVINKPEEAEEFFNQYLLVSYGAVEVICDVSKNFTAARRHYDTFLSRLDPYAEEAEGVHIAFIGVLLRMGGVYTRPTAHFYWHRVLKKCSPKVRLEFIRHIGKFTDGINVWMELRGGSPVASVYLAQCLNREAQVRGKVIHGWLQKTAPEVFDENIQHELFPIPFLQRFPCASEEDFVAMIRQVVSEDIKGIERVVCADPDSLREVLRNPERFAPKDTLLLLNASSLAFLYFHFPDDLRILLGLAEAQEIYALFIHSREELFCRNVCANLRVPFIFPIPEWMMIHDPSSRLRQAKETAKIHKDHLPKALQKIDPNPDRIPLVGVESRLALSAAHTVGFVVKEALLQKGVPVDLLSKQRRDVLLAADLEVLPVEGSRMCVARHPEVAALSERAVSVASRITQREMQHTLNSAVGLLKQANREREYTEKKQESLAPSAPDSPLVRLNQELVQNPSALPSAISREGVQPRRRQPADRRRRAHREVSPERVTAEFGRAPGGGSGVYENYNEDDDEDDPEYGNGRVRYEPVN